MTPSDLVEAAARAIDPAYSGVDNHGYWVRKQAEAALASIGIPLDRLAQLVSGEAWIAPREPTQAMVDAAEPVTYISGWPEEAVKVYVAMRDRYLTPETKL